MNDDLLQRATRALREESLPSDDDLAETRARLMASSSTKRARRASALRWVLPLAAAFVAGSAFAATNGGIERAVRAVQTWLAETQAPEAPAEKRARKPQSKPEVLAVPAPEPQPVAPPEPIVAPTPEASEPAQSVASVPSVPSERPARSREKPRVVQEAPSRVPTVSEAPSADPAPAEPSAEPASPAPRPPSADLALYREAHRAHFTARDYATALTLWERYSKSFPNGIFAIDAAYNRAICLVRLGRKAEATSALRPFAEGQVKGGYRRDEARALLDVLGKKP
ncbi:MAG: hypothetical protein QM778_14425 [Myxococcales bacterium]